MSFIRSICFSKPLSSFTLHSFPRGQRAFFTTSSRLTISKIGRRAIGLSTITICSLYYLYSQPAMSDIWDLNLIYGDTYEYSLPRNILESFLSGKAFDNPDPYSPDESLRLRKDINNLYQKIISQNPVKEKLAVISAGAPGSGKTIKLEQLLEENSEKGQVFAYIDPDAVCLKNQENTYKRDIENGDNSLETRNRAYTKWRPASNAANHMILGNLIREKYAFYFGTTSSSPKTGYFFSFLKDQGYKITLIHLMAPDAVRWESIKKRDEKFVQTTEKDTREKGLLVPQRINDTYLKYADEIRFYYRNGVEEDAVLAAVWLRNTDFSECNGTLTIFNLKEYEKIKAAHNEVVKDIRADNLLWENSVELKSRILTVM